MTTLPRTTTVHGRTTVAAILVLASTTAACGDEEFTWTSPVDFDTAEVAIVGGPADRVGDGSDTNRLLVEVARTEEQRSFGLMLRPSLDQESGMIFLYDTLQPDTSGFWMWRTRMPLDIAFVDSAGQIGAILGMPPCESPDPRYCPTYAPGVPYRSALEVNRGWFEEHGVEVGDRVVIDSIGDE